MNKKHQIASRLYFASAVVGTINALLSYNIFTFQDWIISFISILFVIGIGFLICKGYEWTKYVLAALFIISLNGFQYIFQDLQEYPINGVLSLLISILQIIAMLVLFIKKPTIH
jgi:hypothetical protein